MLELALIIVLLICGAALGGALGATSAVPVLALLLASIGGAAGAIFAYAILHFVKRSASKRKTDDDQSRAIAPSPIGTQVAFRTRLASYLKIDEPKVLQSDSYKSFMPFWSLVDVYWRRTTRTTQEIQTILLRIREHLRSLR
jgi:hypothetical protein